jgi:glyoxylase-like metal-dependent hydrolase (beta-lactamase superfamily II)
MSPPAALRYRVFTVKRPGLGRGVPPGYESLSWVANSATLISGERDAVLVDTFLTVEQGVHLADQVAATGKNLTHIYITHGHGDHFSASTRSGNDSPRRRRSRRPRSWTGWPRSSSRR